MDENKRRIIIAASALLAVSLICYTYMNYKKKEKTNGKKKVKIDLNIKKGQYDFLNEMKLKYKITDLGKTLRIIAQYALVDHALPLSIEYDHVDNASGKIFHKKHLRCIECDDDGVPTLKVQIEERHLDYLNKVVDLYKLDKESKYSSDGISKAFRILINYIIELPTSKQDLIFKTIRCADPTCVNCDTHASNEKTKL